MRLFRRLAVLLTVADVVRRYAKSNPEQFSRIVDGAAGFIDSRTGGRYTKQIDGMSRRLKDITGVSKPG